MYEVELKFPLSDASDVPARLAGFGAVSGTPIEQVDRYFNHPSRDFRVTDEAFRIRSVGTTNCLTYKGPVVDRATKTRREIEVAVAEGPETVSQMVEMLTLLGFRSVREVRKFRTPWSVVRKERRFELAFDQVPSVGTFLEIELLADEAGRNAARDAILDLAKELNLSIPERRSYLELVLASDPSP